jgi:hypothetical protein
MASPSPTKSKRKRIRRAIRRGIDLVEEVLNPSSRPSSPHPSGPAALSAESPSPALSGNPNADTDHASHLSNPIPHSEQSTPHSPTSSSTPGPSSGPGTVSPVPATSGGLNATKWLTGVENAAWTGFESALRVLDKSADAFPPLKSAVGRFLACLDIIQVGRDGC